jgi:hypothetical protein
MNLAECDVLFDDLNIPDSTSQPCDAETNCGNAIFAVGSRFASPDILLQKCREFASSSGFTVATNCHQFPTSNPHPVHGPGKVWQRGKIYCTHKEHSTNDRSFTGSTAPFVKTTSTWFVKFTFDRTTQTPLQLKCVWIINIISMMSILLSAGVLSMSH